MVRSGHAWTVVCGAMAAMSCLRPARADDPMDAYNVVWETPGPDSSASMPIGNGHIGLNVWAEPGGDLLMLVGKTDSWSENGRLLKLGRIRVAMSPNPLAKGLPFRQTLRLRQGEIEVLGGKDARAVRTLVWVDANHPVVRIEATGQEPFDVTVKLEVWRTAPRELKDKEVHSAYSMAGGPDPIVVRPDTVLDDQPDRIVWYHRNETSCWPATMRLQGLEAFMRQSRDPLLHRTFGAAIRGHGLVKVDLATLKSERPAKKFAISACPLTSRTADAREWLKALDQRISAVDKLDLKASRQAHRKWWNDFWNRSWIRVTSTDKSLDPTTKPLPNRIGAHEAKRVSQRYALQRFISACAGRGAFPPKFNGSIFNYDARVPTETYDADYRRWGGCYWFQNTRLIYWPMLASGDFDTMRPLFNLFRDALPLAKARVKRYFGHDGAMFPETMTFWGAYANSNYGWDRKGKDVSHVDNRYIRWYWSGQLELIAIMLDYYAFTQDPQFAETTLLPIAEAVIRFTDEHYRRDDRGKILFQPAQALETWHEAVNPLPEIAGLRFCLPRLLALGENLTTSEQRRVWQRMLSELPPLPMRQAGGQDVLAAAEKLIGPISNSENPELYAVFPFRLFGVGKPDLDMARHTFGLRRVKGNQGWRQDDTQAAFLGLADQAAKHLTDRLSDKYLAGRFPVFWGPNFDWIPDQDHGSNAIMTLQTMLLQTDGKTIHLLPAWPAAWDVSFKLHAPMNTTIQAKVSQGQVTSLDVQPVHRAQDVVHHDLKSPPPAR
ncbi:MAG: hypothetical protein JXQ73_22945 [Phycisphaerae bacterium]|nr:hypothetical protein [Phycisphaerae bacterium]